MSTHVSGFESFFLGFLHHFLLAEVATSSIGVNPIKDCSTKFGMFSPNLKIKYFTFLIEKDFCASLHLDSWPLLTLMLLVPILANTK